MDTLLCQNFSAAKIGWDGIRELITAQTLATKVTTAQILTLMHILLLAKLLVPHFLRSMGNLAMI